MAKQMAVYKYGPLPPDRSFQSLHHGAQVLHAALQRGEMFLWALVDPSQTRKEDRAFLFTGTGHAFEASDGYDHISTVLTEDQRFVFHVFECGVYGPRKRVQS